MSGSSASNSNPSVSGPLTLRVVEAQTSAENGRKFTKYKVCVNYNGRDWEIWRRFKEFNTLNEKVRRIKKTKTRIISLLASSYSFGFEITRLSSSW